MYSASFQASVDRRLVSEGERKIHMSKSTTSGSRRTLLWRGLSRPDLLAFFLIGLPLATAIATVTRTSINIPLEDDYQAIAAFMTVYAAKSGPLHKLAYILTSQHNAYKLILLHTIVVLECALTGHINYRALQLLGSLAVPATIALLWVLLARQHRPFKQAIWLFIPACYLFLSLCYWETLNFAMSELATLAVIPIAVACILSYTSSRPRMEIVGALLLACAIATLASGFFLPFALVPMLLYQRRYASALGVVLVAGAMAILYRVHYTAEHLQAPGPAHHRTILVYPIVFLGDVSSKLYLCAALGTLLLVVFLALLVCGWPRRSPSTFTLALFCLVTAAGVSAGRYSLGLITAMSPRYGMYALLLICAEYMAVIEMFGAAALRRKSLTSVTFAFATIMIGAWAFYSQVKTYRILRARQELIATHLILWERHPDHVVLTPDEPEYMYSSFWIPWRILSQQILQREISAGRYIPPLTASDPLPTRPHSRATVGIEDEQVPTPKHSGS